MRLAVGSLLCVALCAAAVCLSVCKRHYFKRFFAFFAAFLQKNKHFCAKNAEIYNIKCDYTEIRVQIEGARQMFKPAGAACVIGSTDPLYCRIRSDIAA